MLKRENLPICAKTTTITMGWVSSDADNLVLDSAHLTYDNINVTPAGNIPKERTSLPFNEDAPIPWSDTVPANIREAFPDGAQQAIRFCLGELYECDEHQYRLGTKERP